MAETKQLPTPAEINAHLDEYIIGQDDAKRVISVAVHNHYKKALVADMNIDIELGKSNVMMIGPTGTGKTLIASTIAKVLDVPFTMADATALAGAANLGREIDEMMLKLLQKANNDVAKAERGIILIDEVDKLSKTYTRQGESIQQALLKVIEGTTITLRTNSGPININTGNILFIVGGAFVKLDTIVRQRIGGSDLAMFDVEASSLLREHITPEDIAKFGLIPEFIGRLPVIVMLTSLDKAALAAALTKPKNALTKQYQQIFALDGIKLDFHPDALDKIAELAEHLKTGARGLRTILEDRMRDIMYMTPGEKNLRRVVITPEVILKTGKPIFQYTYAIPDTEPKQLNPKLGFNTTP